MNNKIFLVYFSLVLLLAACSPEVKSQQSGSYFVVSAADFKIQMQQPGGVQLIDVRTSGEYKAGHIGEAVNISIADRSFGSSAAMLDKSKPVLVYCTIGARSRSAAQVLLDMGFTKVYDLKGGINAWYREGN